MEVASEPITAENWLAVPNGTVFAVDPDFRLRFEPFGAAALGSEAYAGTGLP